MDLVMK
jgi:hypothetical protein